MKTIYVLELNWLNLPIMLIFRLMGNFIRFLTVTPSLQKETRLKKLNAIGIEWLSYDTIPMDKPVYFWVIKDRLRNILTKELRGKKSINKVINQISFKKLNNNEIMSLIIRKLDFQIQNISELFLFVNFHEEKNNVEKKIWLTNDIVSRSILKNELGYINICPKIWTVIETALNIFFRVFSKLFNKVKNRFSELIFNTKKSELIDKTMNSMQSNGMQKYQVLYFPHCGIWYGDLFKKDHFYSSSNKSPFHPSKIMHMSLGEDISVLKKSIKYYKKNNIPFSDWYDIVESKRMTNFMFFRLYVKLLVITWKEMDIKFPILCALAYKNIYSSYNRLNQLQNLKMVLIGYDILFPLEISLACKILKIKTVAVQERMITAWWTWPIAIDHYFVIGPASSKILKDRFKNLINNSYEVGPVRLDKHLKAIKTVNILKKSLKYKFKVLVLDYLSPTDYYDNGRQCDIRWSVNLKFLKDILKLSRNFPDVFFMIKGKNYDFIKLSYFSEVVAQIEVQPNCHIVKDYRRWTPFTSAAMCDITIAQHTSLGDEILALGKPVIFYDYIGFPSFILDYGKEVLAYNFEDLLEKLNNYFNNPVNYNKLLEPTRKKLYTTSMSSPKKLISDKLLSIYKS
jgi:hypothetical protein